MNTSQKHQTQEKFGNDYPLRLIALLAIGTKRTRLRLTMNEIVILCGIYLIGETMKYPWLCVAELKKAFYPWHPSYLGRRLKGLEKKGYLTRLPGFRKWKFYVLTETGNKILQELNEIIRKTHSDFLNNRPRDKYRQLKRKKLENV
jgi:DNA-binding MarR family transcriptional regulator